jgi:hypothetical protein
VNYPSPCLYSLARNEHQQHREVPGLGHSIPALPDCIIPTLLMEEVMETKAFPYFNPKKTKIKYKCVPIKAQLDASHTK